MDIFLIQDIITLINDISTNKYQLQIGGSKNESAGEVQNSNTNKSNNNSNNKKSNNNEEENKGRNIEDFIILALKILFVIIFLFAAPIVPFIALSYYTYKRLKQKFLTDEEDDAEDE